MRIALIISSLSHGGAERVMSTMANYWAARGWEVHLITLSSRDTDFFPLDPAVQRTALGLLHPSTNPVQSLWNVLRRLMALRRTFLRIRPEVMVSFTDVMNLLVLLAAAGTQLPIVVSERIDPGHHSISFVKSRLRRWLYPAAKALVMQTQGSIGWAEAVMPRGKITIIPNPVGTMNEDSEPEGERGFEDTIRASRHRVVSMGRLTHQKGFDLLIEAFARIEKDFPTWDLLIYGDGEERDALSGKIRDLDLETRIQLPGITREAYAVFRSADLFVLSSRYEGFPNVALEAMASGLPVVAFNCPSGPGEIIRHDLDGLLVTPGDVAGLAEAMAGLMSNAERRHALGAAAREVQERFGMEPVMSQWESLLRKVALPRQTPG